MKSDSQILFSRIRNVSLKYGKSAKFKAWLKEQMPEKDFHHVCGSTMGRKSTDYLAVLVTREEHSLVQDNNDLLIEQLPQGIENLIKYVEYLENKNG